MKKQFKKKRTVTFADLFKDDDDSDGNNDKNNRHMNSDPEIENKKISKDELNEIYEFNYKFDGTIGEPALIFRDNIISYNNYVRDHAGKKYYEYRVVNKIIKSLVGNAASKFARLNGPCIDKLDKFLEWFDRSFRLNSLRQDIFNV